MSQLNETVPTTVKIIGEVSANSRPVKYMNSKNKRSPPALIAAILVICVALPARSQHQSSDSHGDSNGKNHLRGIRPLQWQPQYLNRDEYFVAAGDESDELRYSRRRGRAHGAPIAIAPPKAFNDLGSTIESTSFRPFTASSSIIPTVLMTSTAVAAGEHHKSKWDKIGPLIDFRGSPFQRMRLVQQNLQTTFSPSVTTQTTSNYHAPAVVYTESQRSLQHIATISRMSNHAKKSMDLLDQRRYRPRIRGQILTTIAEPTASAETPTTARARIVNQLINGGIKHLQTSELDDRHENHNDPIIYENYAPQPPPTFRAVSAADYHHRKGHVETEKRFKLAPGKVGYRPRLKIRRPSDAVANVAVVASTAARAAADESASGVPPIRLPNLALLRGDNNNDATPVTSSRSNASTHQFTQKMFIIEEPIPSNADREVVVPVYNFGSNVAVVASPSNAAIRAAAAPTFVGLPKDDGDSNWNEKDTSVFARTGSPLLTSSSTPVTAMATIFAGGEERGSVGEQPPQPTGLRGGESPPQPEGLLNSRLPLGGALEQLPPNLRLEQFRQSSQMSSGINALHQETPRDLSPITVSTITPPGLIVAEPEKLVVPENSGLRLVAPPKELGGFGFGSSGLRGFGGGEALQPPRARPPATNVQVEPPKDDEFFTGDSALTPNKRGPTGDGYGPPVVEGAAVPPLAPPGPVSYGGAAAGILPEESALLLALRPPPVPHPSVDNVRPSALLNILNRADEGLNQVISHFEQSTPIEAAAIDVLEVALGSQKLDSQAKLLSHVDRTIGLDNIQRLQRWANTGGALDMLKEQFAKMAKNYKPPPETKAITIPPQFEYLFQSG